MDYKPTLITRPKLPLLKVSNYLSWACLTTDVSLHDEPLLVIYLLPGSLPSGDLSQKPWHRVDGQQGLQSRNKFVPISGAPVINLNLRQAIVAALYLMLFLCKQNSNSSCLRRILNG